MLGDKIKYLRKKMGYTQEDLAKILRKKYGLRTDRVMISKWETGPQVMIISLLRTGAVRQLKYLFHILRDEKEKIILS